VSFKFIQASPERDLSSALSYMHDKKPLSDVPSIREYFGDLDYVLGVISDGPAKSFVFRRLKYLAKNFGMYLLLNEFQELADTKVRFACLLVVNVLVCSGFPIGRGSQMQRRSQLKNRA
jgi:hypothetical protein